MTDTITITGIVATDPRHVFTNEGLAITSFRLVSPHRRYDKAIQKWVDAESNFFTVTTFRQLAINCATSLKRGERVVVTGRLKIREWDNGEKKGTNVDLEADGIGHDLAWGSSTFSRTVVSSALTSPDEFAAIAPSDQSAAPSGETAASPAEATALDPELEGATPF